MKKLLVASMISMSLSGCMTFREYQKPELPTTVEQTVLNDSQYQFVSAQEPVSAWWNEFNDDMLSSVVDQALVTNLDVRIAYANLLQARALSRSLDSTRYPSVTANGGYTRSLNSQETASQQVRATDTYEAGFDSSWELDLFGNVSYDIQSQKLQEMAIEADLDAMYVTVAAEVARYYFDLRGAQYRLNIAERNAKNQAETYELTQKMFEAGSASALDVSRARTQLSLTQSMIPPLEAEVNAAINRISVLTGGVPDTLRMTLSESQPLPSLPLTVSLGETTDLIKRRPDIRSAERTLAASVAKYNASVSDLFPKVTLLGSLGYISTNLASFGTSALAGALGPSISWQVFDRGRLYAQIDNADAGTDIAMASYEKTVLTALEEIQTALSDFAHEEQRRAALQEAAASANQSVVMAKQRFDHGYDSFLDVLDAERTLLEAEDSLASSEIEAILDLVSIYKSLGGGWQVAPRSMN
jgi:multidrug efflux system outer membrane protein